MKREKLHFTVNPEGMTNLVRSMWFGERSCAKALGVMGCFPIPIEDQLAVIAGTKKLVSDDGVNFELAPDTAIPSKGALDAAPATWEGLLVKLKDLEARADNLRQLEAMKTIIHAAAGVRSARGSMTWTSHASPVGYVTPALAIGFLAMHIDEPTSDEWEDFWKEHGAELRDMNRLEPGETLPLDYIKASNRPPKQVAGTGELAAQWSMHTATDPDIFIAHEFELKTRARPVPDSKFLSPDGWLMPNGSFYPCKYMEHIWLAEKLAGKDEGDVEKMGWIKIGLSPIIGQQIHQGGKPPTQKQLDALFDWSEVHNFKLPEWAGGRES